MRCKISNWNLSYRTVIRLQNKREDAKIPSQNRRPPSCYLNPELHRYISVVLETWLQYSQIISVPAVERAIDNSATNIRSSERSQEVSTLRTIPSAHS